jgi:hypothetical protein
MPLLNYQVLIFLRQALRLPYVPNIQTLRFAKFDVLFDNENRLTVAMANMHVNWKVLIAVEAT